MQSLFPEPRNEERNSGKRDWIARRAQPRPEHVELFIFIPFVGDQMSRNQVITRAEAAQCRPIATPIDISLGLFVSASCVEENELKGAYSVVFRQMSPGTSDHGEVYKMGWNQPFASDEHAANSLAIAQAISIADTRLRAIAAGSQGKFLGNVRVQIFTTSNPALRHIINQAEIRGPRQALHTRVSSLVHQEVQKLADIPGMRVELVLYWVPANSGVTRQKEAGKIAMKCRKNGKSMFFVNDEERPSEDLPKSVSLLVRDVLILERLRINKERRANGMASSATTTLRKATRATAAPAMNQKGPALSSPETPKTQLQEPHPDRSEPRDPSPALDGQALTTEGEEQADEGCHDPLEEQALVDRQLLIETHEHNIRYCRERVLPGRSTYRTQQLWENAAEACCFALEELVPGHPLTRVPPRSLLSYIFSSP
ncbi:hypothetical protein GE21DRAFT_9500 [Neurospora crassa]|uniref:Uncharacterized protein n=2 Tax=Neurospora crassa TaxID=5141 RepID=Q1K5N0_NEUCR|nr:hypothetical protein NCU05106 [Neurospora crassa OR74A]EAA27856.1 hypothetical protein NCU05106 [Neurospora crassa OR74A]KHE87976.1 hypothetical protein GE21DRAFT_9500 [Neurospora crassa]CAD70431.1 hypothetical protein [Neurospora crassa]|eukprot:XP_957092.1 hypothetical protein NCU05106 [Neurospora crassa OR74A]